MKTLAQRIELKLQHGPWQHCAVYEDELHRLWPLEVPYREARIANFAVRYGFRLKFYQKGLCAIFEKASAATENASIFENFDATKSELRQYPDSLDQEITAAHAREA